MLNGARYRVNGHKLKVLYFLELTLLQHLQIVRSSGSSSRDEENNVIKPEYD